MRLVYDHSSAGHPGRDKTLRKAQERYHWPNMKEWITNYIKGCTVCQQNKILTHQTKVPIYHIPTEPNACPFQCVAMDLITGLPPIWGKDAILTIIDQGCSYAAIFLAYDMMIIGPGITQLYLDHIYRWFGLPTKVISDWDPCFMSHFGKGLAKKLGIQQNLSTAFHPQTDSLLEWKNQWVEQYLWLVTSAVLRSGSAPHFIFFYLTFSVTWLPVTWSITWSVTWLSSHDRLIVLTDSLFTTIVRLVRGRLLFYFLLSPIPHCSCSIVLVPIVL